MKRTFVSFPGRLSSAARYPSWQRVNWLLVGATLFVLSLLFAVLVGQGESFLSIDILMLPILLLLTRFLPPGLAVEHPLAQESQERLRAELKPLLGYALLFPLILIPVVVWELFQPLSLFPLLTDNWALTWNYAIVGKALLLAVPVLYFTKRYGGTLQQLGITNIRQSWRWLGAGIVTLCYLLIPLAIVVASLSAVQSRAVPAGVVIALVIIFLFAGGFAEEFLYRVLLQTRLELVVGRWNGLVLASLLFGLMHLPSRFAFGLVGNTHSFVDFLLALAAVIVSQGLSGFFYGYVWMRYRNAWLNVLLHGLYDVLTNVALLIGTIIHTTR